MSEAFFEYARPLYEQAVDLNSKKVAISIAALCWNVSLSSGDEQKDIINELVAKISDLYPAGDKEIIENIIMMFMDRKKRYFSEFNKLILNYELTPTDEGLHLSVISTSLSDD